MTSGVKVIFDADMSSDHDDVGAIATLHALADLGECEILGMMVSSTNGGTATCMDAINTYYGRPAIPIGVRPDMVGSGSYPGTISAEFPHDLRSAADCPLAVTLYRQLLSAAADNSVTIATAGYLTNLKALLQSAGDSFSPLNGSQLVAQKVKLLSCMGGTYPSGSEFNFRSSGDDSAYVVVNSWPTAAMYAGFGIGTPLGTGGRLQQTSVANPIRRVWQLKGGDRHPSYDQTAVYYAVRPAEGVWGALTIGHNTAAISGANAWAAAPDPSGVLDQGYLVEKARSVVQQSIDTLMMAVPKITGQSSAAPSPPSHLRAVAVSATAVELRWTDNSYNETGFVVELGTNGVFAPSATVGANVTSTTVTGLSSTANKAFRVKAVNAVGSSDFTYVWLYSGWTEVNLESPNNLPLYGHFRSCDLYWARGGDYRPNHVVVNDDSAHGRDLTVDVDVGAQGAQGTFFVYFFYTDADNWYRLKVDTSTCCFERKVAAGPVTQVGASGPVSNIGNGTFSRAWRVQTTAAGTLTFTVDGIRVLSVSDSLRLTTGKVGLGGLARTPLWENFNFVTG